LLSQKNDKNENNGPGVKLIEAKKIKAWAISELKRKLWPGRKINKNSKQKAGYLKKFDQVICGLLKQPIFILYGAFL
jgi:hypothetical protein